MALSLKQLCENVPGLDLYGDADLCVERVTADSRACGPGTLFVAVTGTAGDGHRYLEAAVAAGSSAVARSRSSLAGNQAPNVGGAGEPRAVLVAPNTRPLPALLARELNGRPDARLLAAGVTGTNGKTTVAFLLREMISELRGPCGLLGTISYEDGRESESAPLTTPGGPVLYEWLDRMAANGCAGVALEVSSHALDQERAAGLELDVAVMTNLGRDHLDYHRDTETYLAAKARIVELLGGDGQWAARDKKPGVLVLNADDPLLAGIESGGARTVRFSVGGAGAADADLVVREAELGLTGTRLAVDLHGTRLELESPLVGRFNVENLTAALAAGVGLGLAGADCARALAGVRQVPGRFERFVLPQGALAVVDYAHTHDALEAVLGACDELSEGRILCVFGCGGDRDHGKRPLMGAVAARCSDAVWITSDNPRSEDPDAICAMVAEGLNATVAPRAADHRVVVDRRAAIEAALDDAGTGDVVVIAGKGHEDYQLAGDRVLHLDDREIVAEWLARGGGDA